MFEIISIVGLVYVLTRLWKVLEYILDDGYDIEDSDQSDCDSGIYSGEDYNHSDDSEEDSEEENCNLNDSEDSEEDSDEDSDEENCNLNGSDEENCNLNESEEDESKEENCNLNGSDGYDETESKDLSENSVRVDKNIVDAGDDVCSKLNGVYEYDSEDDSEEVLAFYEKCLKNHTEEVEMEYDDAPIKDCGCLEGLCRPRNCEITGENYWEYITQLYKSEGVPLGFKYWIEVYLAHERLTWFANALGQKENVNEKNKIPSNGSS